MRVLRRLGIRGPDRSAAIVAAILIVLALLVDTSNDSSAFIGEADLLLIAAFGAYGLNLITGYAGQASIGNAGFMAVGGIIAWFVSQHGFGFIVSVLVGTAAGAVLGALVGALALRWRGFYLVLATLAVQYIVVFVLQQIQLGGSGQYVGGFTFNPASAFGTSIFTDSSWFTLLAVVLAVVVVLLGGLLNGRFGRSWRALRENEIAAAVAGVPVARRKILAFAIGSGIIALGGALSAYYAGSMSYESFTLDLSVSFVAMIIIGGLGSVTGPLLGAAVVTLLPYVIQQEGNTSIGQTLAGINGGSGLSYLETLVYCVIVLLFLWLEPRGLAAVGSRIAAAGRRRLTGRDADGEPPAMRAGSATPMLKESAQP